MIDFSLNYSNVRFIELLRDELVRMLNNGGSVIKAMNNMDTWYHTNIGYELNSFSNMKVNPSKANLFRIQKADAIRRVLHDAESKGLPSSEAAQIILQDYGNISSDDYPIHATFFCQEYDLFSSYQSVWNAFEDPRLYKRQAVFVWENKANNPIVKDYIEENYENYHKKITTKKIRKSTK